MARPWLKKNPFMSLWLSGANTAADRARMQARAAITKQVTRFWSGAWLARKTKRRS
jgi:hypothetical protein